jgi:hypothetical protein
MTVAEFERPSVQELCATLPHQTAEQTTETASFTYGGFLDAVQEFPSIAIASPLPERGVNWFNMLRRQHIISADVPDPLEIDDGVFVEELPTHAEMYRVGTCVPDIADLMADPELRAGIFDKVEARYGVVDGKRLHDPLVPDEYLRSRELKAGETRKAMIVSFLVGADHPPSDVRVSFEEIMTLDNIDYRSFSDSCQSGKQFERFARASMFIVRHLGYRQGLNTSNGSYYGSKIIESYNVAPNHLVGKLLADESIWPAVYRRREEGLGQRDEVAADEFAAGMAYFSAEPGVHAGFRLDPICRISSPLRRLEDAWMNYVLKQRDLGHVPTADDFATNLAVVDRLNQFRLSHTIANKTRVA